MSKQQRDMRAELVLAILTERGRQIEKWGEKRKNPEGLCLGTRNDMANILDRVRELVDAKTGTGTITWAEILLEEFLEVLTEPDPEARVVELIQVGAVAVAWAEAIRMGAVDLSRNWKVSQDTRPVMGHSQTVPRKNPQ